MAEIPDGFLNVGAVRPRSAANGPGERFVLWLQGCLLHCPGCTNQGFLPQVEREVCSVDEVADRVLATEGIEGVTYTGGEPTLQARPLVLLGERLRPAGLTVVCYTGYTLEELHARCDAWTERLLAGVDILIDGPFVRAPAANLLWRGSSNQRIHFPSERYRHLMGRVEQDPAQVELAVGPGGLIAVGTWPDGFVDRLRDVLGS